jgi:hypothetical protein
MALGDFLSEPHKEWRHKLAAKYFLAQIMPGQCFFDQDFGHHRKKRLAAPAIDVMERERGGGEKVW